jgi:hypothetical protein
VGICCGLAILADLSHRREVPKNWRDMLMEDVEKRALDDFHCANLLEMMLVYMNKIEPKSKTSTCAGRTMD